MSQKLSTDLREIVIKEIVSRAMNVESIVTAYDDLLRSGSKGLDNMTDNELYEEYKRTLDGYDLLKEIEVELAIDDLLAQGNKESK